MKNYKKAKWTFVVLAIALITFTGKGQSTQPNASSAKKSLSSVTLAACNAVADELKASRELIAALDAETSALKGRLESEKQLSAALTELSDTRRVESEGLRATLAAKNDTIAAKDAVIAKQDQLIDSLKRKRSSAWQRLGDILIGAAAVMLIK